MALCQSTLDVDRSPSSGCWCIGEFSAAHFATANNLSQLQQAAHIRLSAAALEAGLRTGRVSWKGRAYDVDAPDANALDWKAPRSGFHKSRIKELRSKR
jgi:hypothetical protein